MDDDPDKDRPKTPTTPVIKATDLGQSPPPQSTHDDHLQPNPVQSDPPSLSSQTPLSPLSSPGATPTATSALARARSATQSAPALTQVGSTAADSAPARPARRRRRSKHIQFTVSTDSEEEERRSSSVRGSRPHISGNHENGIDGPLPKQLLGQADEEKEKSDGKGDKPKSKARQLFDKVLANPHIAWVKPKLNKNDAKPVVRTALSVRLPST